jgi:hypothetical protein
MTFYVEGLTLSREPEQQVRRVGAYETLESAIAAAKQVINEFLARELKPDMLPSMLFSRYQECGEVPVIFCDEDDKTVNVAASFNHLHYALARCGEMNASKRQGLF